MKIDESMAERAARGVKAALYGEYIDPGIDAMTTCRVSARAALTAALGDVEPSDDLQDWINGLAEQLAEARNERDAAIAALGDVEPLESVLESVGAYFIYLDTRRLRAFQSEGWDVTVYGEKVHGGTGPTIDAAIRAAVANAKGGVSDE